MPRSRYALAIRTTADGGTSPSNGQPKAVAMPPDSSMPALSAIRATSLKPSSDSAIERLTFLRLWLSDAEQNTAMTSTPASAARSAPLALGTSTVRRAPVERSAPATTSAASASCGTARGETKEVTSISRTPAAMRPLTTAIFSSVGMKVFSIWKPSRGPTSRTVMKRPSPLGSAIVPILGSPSTWKSCFPPLCLRAYTADARRREAQHLAARRSVGWTEK
jgi:hypothetical protein